MQKVSRWHNGISGLICLTILAVMSMLPVRALAQFGASLTGTVQDPSQGVVSGATVTLTDTGTQQARTVKTNDSGFYHFGSLPGGVYTLVVEAAGFKKSASDNVTVTAETPRSFDVTLTVGGATDTVTVNAEETIALQNADATISTTLSAEQFQKVPTFGRDPYNLIRTAPGISGDGARSGTGTASFLPNSVGPGGSNFGIAATENTVQITASGQRITSNNFLIDGVSVNSLGYGGAAVVTPNIEAIGSTTIISTSFSAEDGRNSGAQIKVVTKSGTNQLHGSAFFQYDEPGLNSFNKYGGLVGTGTAPVRVSVKGRDYAASLGGPVIKDKLFLFGSFEGLKQSILSFPSAYIETQQYRDAIHAQRPGSVADQIINAPGGVPRVRNVLTQSCTSPVSFGTACQVVNGGIDIGSPLGQRGTYASFAVPGQIQGGGGLDGIPDIQFVQLNSPLSSVSRQYNGRVDYFATQKDQLAASAYVTNLYRTDTSANSRSNANAPFDPTNIAATFIYIHTFGPNLLNEFRSNWTRFSENGVTDNRNAGINLGLPRIEIQNLPSQGPYGPIIFGAPAAPTSPGIFAENQYEIRDTVTKTVGSHTFRIGFEGRLEQNNNNLVGSARPTYTFAGPWNFFNDAPIFEGISADPATGGQGNASRHLHDHYYSAFLQHDWKVTPQLTLNTGLRWEYFEPIYNAGFRVNQPLLGTTPGRELLDAILVPVNHLWQPNFKNFSPKFGFAYSPQNLSGKTVLRGGFALAFNRLDDVLFDPSLENGPGIFNYGICCGTFPGDFGPPAPNGSSTPYVGGNIVYGLGSSTAYNSFAPNPALRTAIGGNGLPTNGVGIEVYGAERRLPQPYSYLYSLEIQNELGKQVVLTVGYQGATGRHYSRLVNQNFIFPNASNGANNPLSNGFYRAQDDSNLYYNGLNVHVVKRYHSGLSLDGTYTYSKALDQVSSGDGADGSANQTDPARNFNELGPSDFDIRHRFTGIATYNLAFYHGDSQLRKLAFNGWQANGIFTAHTGFPFTPTTFRIQGIPTSATASIIGPVRPTFYRGSYSPTCSNDAFINGTTISGQFGVQPVVGGAPPGIGRNSFRGPCYQDIDLGIAKEVSLPFLGEQSLLRFQAQAFNLINKLNLTPIGFGSQAALLDNSVDANGNVIRTNTNGSATPFGRPVSASAGRVIEFNARFQF